MNTKNFFKLRYGIAAIFFCCATLFVAFLIIYSNSMQADAIINTSNDENSKSLNTQVGNDNCLTFTAAEESTISIVHGGDGEEINPNFEISINGDDWKTYTIDSVISLSKDDVIKFRGDNPGGLNLSFSQYVNFQMTGKINSRGSVMSLLDKEGSALAIPNTFCFIHLFDGCSGLYSPPELPATTLKLCCYYYMFRDSSISTIPVLPATNVSTYAYTDMFYGCINLYNNSTELDNKLLFKDLGSRACWRMFEKCTNLVKTPNFPNFQSAGDFSCIQMFSECTSLSVCSGLNATSLGKQCYSHMFYKCIKLIDAPTLPATTLANECYSYMFQYCESLEVAPVLPAVQLVEMCYHHMFEYCTALNYVKVSFSDWGEETTYTDSWLYKTASNGTFECSSSLAVIRGPNLIPVDWTVKNGGLIYNSFDYNNSYDANEHSIYIQIISPDISECTITYSTDGQTYFTEAPTWKNVCDAQTVYYRISTKDYGDASGSNTVTIMKKDSTVKLSGSQSKTYGDVDPILDNKYTAKFNTVQGEKLTEGVDYSVYRELGDNAGDYNVHVNISDTSQVAKNYNFTESGSTAKFIITTFSDFENAIIEGVQAEYEWTGEAIIPEPTVSYKFSESHTKTFTKDIDYVVELTPGDEYVDPGNHQFIIRGKSGSSCSYNSWKLVSFVILRNLPKITYEAFDYNDTYDGNYHSINVSVTEPTTGYTLVYSSDGISWDTTAPTWKNVCENQIVYFKITAPGYTDASGSNTVTITKKDASASVSGSGEKTYGDVDPQVGYSAQFTDLVTGESLDLGTDYVFAHFDGDDPSSQHDMSINILETEKTNNYNINVTNTGTLKINQFTDYENSIIEQLEPTYVYTGDPVCPKPVVSYLFEQFDANNAVNDVKTIFEEGKDYELSYENNTEIGTAKIIITGKEPYCSSSSSIVKTFNIVGEVPEPVPPQPDNPEIINSLSSATGDSLPSYVLATLAIISLMSILILSQKREKLNR